MVRCKFRCFSIARKLGWSEAPIIIEVSMSPVMAKEGEDSIFGKATPSGQVLLGIHNPEAAALFEVGTSYYLDITRAD